MPLAGVVVRDVFAGTSVATTISGLARLDFVVFRGRRAVVELQKIGYEAKQIVLSRGDTASVTETPESRDVARADRHDREISDHSRCGPLRRLRMRCQEKLVTCFDPTALAERPVSNIADFLIRAEGVTMGALRWRKREVDGESQRSVQQHRHDPTTIPPAYCFPNFFIDGYEWSSRWARRSIACREQPPNGCFTPTNVKAIEVYPSEKPRPMRFLGSRSHLRRGRDLDEVAFGMIRVCLAGATGWAGSELARAFPSMPDLTLVAAVARKSAGRSLGDVLGATDLDCPIYATAAEALTMPCDVFVEYTKPESAKPNILAALEHGAHVVIGTSGLTDDDLGEIDRVARERNRGVLAVGNFALTVVLLQKFAEMAAKLIPQWEIIDYAHDDKPDAPSGTARELASRLSGVRAPSPTIPSSKTVGRPEARGATVAGSQVHSIRLPGFVIGAEVIFGMPDQRLSIRHDAGTSARPYVDGALLAIRKVSTLVGVHRGLDAVLEL